MHDQDREKATSLVKNLRMPNDEEVLKGNPFFNRVPEAEPEIKMVYKDLYSMA